MDMRVVVCGNNVNQNCKTMITKEFIQHVIIVAVLLMAWWMVFRPRRY